ncbi:MAG: NAD-dependent epimerase/dehydratase family protein [Gemmatimonadaceae bacterium]|nr:NAD-dependent epimerase/dehydratase family protein [Gemmatimonadaceae bacterium]
MSRLLVTGSSGLIGSEMVAHFAQLGWDVHGVDSNQRAVFFGSGGDTRWMQHRLTSTLRNFRHHELDVRDRGGIDRLLRDLKPDAIVHAAAQPSHDRAASIPFDDFDTNAVGTLNLLQAARTHCIEAPFVHFSTNKVYGDAPNEIALAELDTRWDYADPAYAHGIAEDFRIDRSTHSIFGASKVAADVMVQEYGRYFGMRTCALRGGCLTGPSHSGVELHGFLSYLVKVNVEGGTYRIFGYKGKQVRDNIHSRDVAMFAEAFIAAPRSGEVYNLGGGKGNSCSIVEAFGMVAERTGKPMRHEYVEQNRVGDHICYYSDLRRMMAHYPGWSITVALPTIFDEIVEAWQRRLK